MWLSVDSLTNSKVWVEFGIAFIFSTCFVLLTFFYLLPVVTVGLAVNRKVSKQKGLIAWQLLEKNIYCQCCKESSSPSSSSAASLDFLEAVTQYLQESDREAIFRVLGMDINYRFFYMFRFCLAAAGYLIFKVFYVTPFIKASTAAV